jgi:Kef-type K+ transport system membrane component KefB
MVTAEFAVALPAVVMVVVAAVCAVIAVTDQMRCVDAAAIAARLAARGEPAAVVRTAALQAAPAGARLELLATATTVTATVTAHLTAPGFLHRLPAITARGKMVAAREAGGPAATP